MCGAGQPAGGAAERVVGLSAGQTCCGDGRGVQAAEDQGQTHFKNSENGISVYSQCACCELVTFVPHCHTVKWKTGLKWLKVLINWPLSQDGQETDSVYVLQLVKLYNTNPEI